MGLGAGNPQFTIATRVDGKLIREQAIHDPFLFNKTVVGMSRWDLFKALFRRQFTVTVETSVRGSEGIMRAVMTIDPEKVERDTAEILEARRKSREENAGFANCYAAAND